MKLRMYFMAPEPISTSYFINPSRQSVSMCIPLSLLDDSVKCYCCNEYTRNNRRIIGAVVFYAVRIVWKESRRLAVPTTACFFTLSISRSSDVESQTDWRMMNWKRFDRKWARLNRGVYTRIFQRDWRKHGNPMPPSSGYKIWHISKYLVLDSW
jgi:hypothetical protein